MTESGLSFTLNEQDKRRSDEQAHAQGSLRRHDADRAGSAAGYTGGRLRSCERLDPGRYGGVTGPLHQPRIVLARLQPARARGSAEYAPPAAGAFAVPV